MNTNLVKSIERVIFFNVHGIAQAFSSRSVVREWIKAADKVFGLPNATKYFYHVRNLRQEKVKEAFSDIDQLAFSVLEAEDVISFDGFTEESGSFFSETKKTLYISTSVKNHVWLKSDLTLTEYVEELLRDEYLGLLRLVKEPINLQPYVDFQNATKNGANLFEVEKVLLKYEGMEPVLICNDGFGGKNIVNIAITSCTALRYGSKETSKKKFAFVYPLNTEIFTLGVPYPFSCLKFDLERSSESNHTFLNALEVAFVLNKSSAVVGSRTSTMFEMARFYKQPEKQSGPRLVYVDTNSTNASQQFLKGFVGQ